MAQQIPGHAQEDEYVLRSESEFRIEARRDKLLGLWVAERLGFPASEAEAYAQDVVIADLEEPGDKDVVRKVLKDFKMRGVPISERELRNEMAKLYQQAVKEINHPG